MSSRRRTAAGSVCAPPTPKGSSRVAGCGANLRATRPDFSVDTSADPGGVGLAGRYARHMATTLCRLLVHLVFSTKNRRELITPEIEPRLYGYIGGVCRGNNSVMLAGGGMPDHVHLLVSLGKTVAVADLLLEIKRDSSAWIKTIEPALADFKWQEGYGAFTIGESQVAALQRYIANQRDHHRTMSFQDEFRALPRKYKIEFDERYLWD